MAHEDHDRFARFRGCLLGGALGDALGYRVEFINHGEIVRRFGAATPSRLALDGKPPALFSDDTQMTLFTAEGVIRALHRMRSRGICHPPSVLARAYVRWFETQGDPDVSLSERAGWLQRVPGLWARRAPGNTCMSALATLSRTNDLPTIDHPPNDSKGCGAVMRVAPIGLAAHARQGAFELARDSSVLTHGHPSGYLSAAYFASLICDLARGQRLDEAMHEAATLTSEEDGCEELLDIIECAANLAQRGVPSAADLEALGGGWTGEEALAIALACALTADLSSSDGFRDALWRAAAHSGDSDSTAAICGNLLGAMAGDRVLPRSWLAELELREVIERIAKDLYDAVVPQVIDEDAYPPN